MKSKFDINTVVGFLLIGAIFLYFGYFSPTTPVAADEATMANDSTTTEIVAEESVSLNTNGSNPLAALAQDSIALNTDTLKYLKYQLEFGPFAQSMLENEETKTYSLENNLLKLSFSNKGAQLIKAELKDFQTYDSLPLNLIDSNSNFSLLLQDERLYNTADLNFKVIDHTANTLKFALQTDAGASLVYEYSLAADAYMVDWSVETNGMAPLLKHDQSELIWELQANRHEKNRENEITRTEMQYQLAVDEDVDNFNSTSADEELVEEALNWVAYRQQFFTTILQLKGASFSKAALAIRPLEDEGHTKYMASSISYPSKASGELDLEMGLYLGPNKYEILKSYDAGFEELIPLGWGILGWINRGIVLNIFNWLEAYGLNYGLIILIIALIIKMILFPLTYSSYRSMAKMRVLKPEIDALAEKHPDAMKKQQATMELYRKAGVSPLGGCLPMLLQFPILIALFQFFPASIELRQQSFLWATDLSTYDSIYDLPFTIPFYGDHISLFTLLMTVSTLIYTYMNQQLTGSAQTQQFPQMKYIIYLMPIMFLGVFNNYASGLSYYYFVANVITFSQQFAIRSFIDEDKIKAKIAERKEKPQKENRLMRRMREVQDQQNRQQRRTK
ncbi:MAG: membrane protein insertase YidC [Bacteroidetes bacterium]|nr:MAG: membrane protein insertase YidC [Bacteroidota bacterium]